MTALGLNPDDMPTQHALKPLIKRALRELGGRAHRRQLIVRAKQLGAFSNAQLEKPTHSLGKRRQYRTELDYRLSWALHGCHTDGSVAKAGEGFWTLAETH
jgi:hypothetical protein